MGDSPVTPLGDIRSTTMTASDGQFQTPGMAGLAGMETGRDLRNALDFDLDHTYRKIELGTLVNEMDTNMAGLAIIRGLGKKECQDRAVCCPDLLGTSKRTLQRVTDAMHQAPPAAAMFAIFDGHAGPACSDFLCKNLVRQFWVSMGDMTTNFDSCDLIAFLEKVMLDVTARLEARFIKEFNLQGRSDGSTGNVVLLWGDILVCVNVGDSRSCISKTDQSIIPLSEDHKPNRPDEKARVAELGVNIKLDTKCGEYRLDIDQKGGRLSMTRSFGDSPVKERNKGVLIATGEVRSHRITDDMDFLLLASDGVWCRIDWEEAMSIVRHQLTSTTPLKSALTLIKRAKELKSSDDISTVVVKMDHYIKQLRR